MAQTFVTFERDAWTGAAKAVPLSAALGLSATPMLTTTDEAYITVPWLYRAAVLRASTVSRMPYCIEDLATGEDVAEDDPRVINITRWMTRTLYLAELARVLYGAAYFLLESNRFGLNVTPRYIPRSHVTPNVDYVQGVTGFTVSFTQQSNVTVPLDRMVYMWEPNPASEIAPGPAPAYVALQAAGMLGALDRMATAYFQAGAVPITAVKVPPAVSKDDREKLENWFGRFASGFRNAFKFMAVSQGVEFQNIGANVKETAAAELTQAQRDNVAVALGVPPTVLDGKAANFATANSEMMGFYMHTVLPSCELIQEALNAQLFERAGLSFEFEPEKLEIMQTAQLEQAATLQNLTGGKPILSQNEARDMIDFDAVYGGDWPLPPGVPASAASMGEDMPMPAPGASAATLDVVDSPAEPIDPAGMSKAWLEASLAAWKAGQSAAVGTPWDAELVAASSANQVKRIFAAHWPTTTTAGAPTWQERAVSELARFNALAGQEGTPA